MTEIVRYTLLGREDLAFGIGTFEVRLADGRVVTLSKIDLGVLLSDSSISTQNVNLNDIETLTLDVATSATMAALTIGGAGLLTVQGGRIVFPATQISSTNANTLDDYEEGIWTISLGGTATYDIRVGTYIKIGKQVTVRGLFRVTAIGTGSGSVISGLPFPVVNTTGNEGVGAVRYSALSASVVNVVAVAVANTSTIQLYSASAAGTSLATTSIITSATEIQFSVTYEAST